MYKNIESMNISRRKLLKGTAALTVGFYLAPNKGKFSSALADPLQSFAPNAFIRIEADNTVKVIINHSEMGQGIYTSLTQIIADELDADWDLMTALHLNSVAKEYGHTAFGVIATGGSTSVATEWDRFRLAAATAKSMLIEAAAQKWSVDPGSLITEKSRVIDPNSDRKISYGELSNHASKLTPPQNPKLKTPDQYSIIGSSVKRIEGKSKVNGSAVYGMDLQLPDMLVASVAHSPVFGGRLKAVDTTQAQSMPGVRKIVEISTGVAVIADHFWAAKKAKDALEIQWDEGDYAEISTPDLWQEYSQLADEKGMVFEQRGELDFSNVKSEISGEYRFPYLAHAPMEPLNTTVQIKNGQCEVWSGTQFQGVDVGNIAARLNIDIAKIKLNTLWLGGGFGRRAVPSSDFVVEAAEIAQKSALDVPIKMVWQREDDIQGGYYRPMFLHRYRVAMNDQGLPEQWSHQIVGGSIAQGTAMESMMVHNGVDHLSVEGLQANKYQVEKVEFSLQTPVSPVPLLWWRSVGNTHTAPVVEGIINQLAAKANADPINYRRQLLSNNKEAFRMLGVLDSLEEHSNWKEKPAENIYRGVAVHESFGSVCGYVVELKKNTDKLSFHKITSAIDCGLAINPENIKAQVFGAAAYGLASMFDQQITIENGRPVQSNFHDYPVIKLAQMPNIDVHIVDNGLDKPTGVGEPGLPPIIPALLAAVFEATGQQVMDFPMMLDGYSFA